MNKKVLIVDNDADCLEIMRDALICYGFDVQAEDGRSDVIKAVDGFLPDVVLIDYLLDGINGGEWCAQLKRDAYRYQLPVIIVSAHSKVINSLGD
ncbi:response regulator transcription factor [Mucilaginibacter ginkgonis]|uniref:Response regulator n=1 Tax=Mucilaginibacter ginkgonis TaxID=2682091 RepID=A0A6I4I2G8_9SPHI|nr:response regulator [Mucilaginibacter ginkgonis]QQL49422.1 response regulator [Mucilaginibacter ginkgonis]